MSLSDFTFDFKFKTNEMESKNVQLHTLDLFTDGGTYIDCLRLYFSYFNRIPTMKTIGRINTPKLSKWLEKDWEHKIVKRHARQYYNRTDKKLEYEDVFYLVDSDILLNLEGHSVRILHLPEQEKEAVEILNIVKGFTRRKKKTQEISLVINGRNGLNTTSIKIKKPALDLSVHYNDDLKPQHEKILQTLKEKDKSGLYLFHGVPGTGKSTYIRYLTRSISKKVIFISPGLAANMDTPDVTSLLIDNANTVFVIEDAEELLGSRDNGKNSGISTLLNLTDGLLGESLGIQIIATFNTDLRNIDKALLRKGRLIVLYDFKALSVEKSIALLKYTGCTDYPIKGPMTLAEIFNAGEEGYGFEKNARPQIGFLSAAV